MLRQGWSQHQGEGSWVTKSQPPQQPTRGECPAREKSPARSGQGQDQGESSAGEVEGGVRAEELGIQE